MLNLTNGLLILIAILTTLNLFHAPTSSTAPRTIPVMGEASKEVVPNIAKFSFSIRALNRDQSKAAQEVNKKTNTLLETLYALPIEKKYIQTKHYRVHPHYNYNQGNRKFEGYEVSQMIELTLKKLETIPALLTTLTKHHIANLQGPHMYVDKSKALYETLQSEAILNAKEKAERLSKKLNVKLEKIVGFSEQENHNRPPIQRHYSMAKASSPMGSTPPTIHSGVQKIKTTVTLHFLVEE
jgi:uncharacterized protein YggE